MRFTFEDGASGDDRGFGGHRHVDGHGVGHGGGHGRGHGHGHGHGGHDGHDDGGHHEMHGGFRPGFGPGFGHGGHGPFGGHRGRRRGNVRAAILALLTERPMHGYEMIQELDQRTGGVWRPSPGSVYPTLQLLEDEGLIASEEGGTRRAYSLTEAGQAEAAIAAANAPWAEFSAESVASGHDTREAIGGIMMALRQIGFERDPEQWARAVEVLQETKRKLYAILATEE